MPRPREAAPDAGTRGLWAEYMVRRGGARPGLEPPQRPPPLRPPPAPRPLPLGPGGSWRPSPHAPPRRPPPAAPLGGGGLCRARLRTAPPASRRPGGGGGQSAPAPPRPLARAGAVTGRAALGPSAPPPPSPSSRLVPGGRGRRGRRGGARRACAGVAPSLLLSLARSLPPSQLRRVTALAPRAPAAGAAAPPFRAPGPRLSAGSTFGSERPDGPACVRPCAPSEPRAELPPPPRPATTTRSPPPAAPPPAPSPLPPRPSAQARPPAREPIGRRRRARVRPRRARPHWPPRGNVSHMQIRKGRGGLRLAPSRPGAGPREEGGREGALQ